MKLEAAKGASHAANAAAAFIHAAQQHLPREAFEELRGLSLNQVRQWAEKWGVDAPCILEIARDWCEGGWTEGETVDAYCGPAIPREWFEQLNELNRLPVDAGWLETGLENIMSDGERRAELGALKAFRVEVLKEDRALAPPGADPPRESESRFIARARADARGQRERYLKDQLPAVRDELLGQDQALAPIGADPLRESEPEFIKRARHHFEARVRRGRRFGYTVVSPKLRLGDHMNWLIRFQLHRETRGDIAASSHTVREAVDRAIRELAKLLDLTLRTSDTAGR